MTDRELLEYAAKAAGYTWVMFGSFGDAWWHTNPDVARPWNPIADDGDALRLAVKVRILAPELDPSIATAQLEIEDPYAATRRAIVRAAAEIGKAMD